jgi:hypothetical protein
MAFTCDTRSVRFPLVRILQPHGSVSENHYPSTSPKKPEMHSCTVEWEFIDILRAAKQKDCVDTQGMSNIMMLPC